MDILKASLITLCKIELCTGIVFVRKIALLQAMDSILRQSYTLHLRAGDPASILRTFFIQHIR